MAIYNGREVTVLSTEEQANQKMATIYGPDYGNIVVKLSEVKFTQAEKDAYKKNRANETDHIHVISDKEVQEIRDGQDPKKTDPQAWKEAHPDKPVEAKAKPEVKKEKVNGSGAA